MKFWSIPVAVFVLTLGSECLASATDSSRKICGRIIKELKLKLNTRASPPSFYTVSLTETLRGQLDIYSDTPSIFVVQERSPSKGGHTWSSFFRRQKQLELPMAKIAFVLSKDRQEWIRIDPFDQQLVDAEDGSISHTNDPDLQLLKAAYGLGSSEELVVVSKIPAFLDTVLRQAALVAVNDLTAQARLIRPGFRTQKY